MSEEITRMPAVALRGMTILPSMIVHFDVSRDKSIKAIEQAMTADQKLFVVTQRDPEASDPGIDDLYHIGTVVEIKQLVKLPKNIIRNSQIVLSVIEYNFLTTIYFPHTFL